MKKLFLLSLLTLLTVFGLWQNQKLEALPHPQTLFSVPNFLLNDDDRVSQMVSGFDHGLVLTEQGKLYVWGSNEHTQSGLGLPASTHPQFRSPIEIPLTAFNLNAEEELASIYAGHAYNMVLTNEGRVFAWGRNHHGQLGDGSLLDRSTPVEITAQFNLQAQESIETLFLSSINTVALTSQNRVFIWGQNVINNEFPRLGTNDMSVQNQTTPLDITHLFPANDPVVDVALARLFTFALTASGEVFSWGVNLSGVLGTGDALVRATPVNITEGFNLSPGDTLIQVSASENSATALSQQGQAFTWGANNIGQLANGTSSSANTPQNITGQFSLVEGDRLIDLAMGLLDHGYARTHLGHVFTWGSNAENKLGLSPINGSSRNVPTRFTYRFPSNDPVAVFAYGGYHSYALTEQGKLYTWGRNNRGQVGLGTTTATPNPTLMSTLSAPSRSTITFLSNGGSHVEALQAIVGAPIVEPTPPIKVDYLFDGWYLDEALTQPFVFTSMPSQNITLYAKWRFAYEVSFTNLPEGDSISPVFTPLRGVSESALILHEGVPYREIFHPLMVGDFNDDGYDDLMIYSTSSFEILINNHNGTFTKTSVAHDLTGHLWDYVMVDFDDDGHEDILLVFQNSGLRWMRARGDGTFEPAQLISGIQSNGSFFAVDAVVVSRDGQRHVDLYAIGATKATLFVADESGVYSGTDLHTFSAFGREIKAVDLNDDGILDVIFSNNQTTWFALGLTEGGFSSAQAIPNVNGSQGRYYLQDNGQGVVDVFVKEPGNRIVQLRWNEAFQVMQVLKHWPAFDTYIANYGWMDLNGDGIVDLYGSNPNNLAQVRLALSSDQDSYHISSFSTSTTIGAPASLNLFDDGDLYIVVVRNDGNLVTLARSLTTGDYRLQRPADPLKEGHTFLGWVIAQDNTPYTFDVTLEPGLLTLEAVWQLNRYTLTFESNGGAAQESLNQDFATPLTLPIPLKAGFTFGGWYVDESLAQPFNEATMPAQNITLYAQWTPTVYSISYILAGGDLSQGAPSSYTVQTPTFTLPLPTRDSHTFLGWHTLSDFSDDPIETITQGSIGALVLYAAWRPNTFTLTFIFEESLPSEVFVITLGAIVPTPPTPARTGYTFLGFDSEVPTLMPEENLVFVALWQINDYTMTFNTDGGTHLDPITLPYDALFEPPIHPTRVGHTFLGWDNPLPNRIPAEHVTFTALWQINTYTLSFDSAGGGEVVSITRDFDQTFARPSDPTRVGHTFIGWDGSIPERIPAQNLTFTAIWSVNTYTLSFNSDGGSRVSAITTTFDERVFAPAPPTREGYTFLRWNQPIPTRMPAEDVRLTARWQINNYRLTIMSDDAVLDSYDILFGSPFPSLTPPLLEGFHFTGWYLDEAYTLPFELTEMPARDVTLYARFEPRVYTVSYVLEGGVFEGEVVRQFTLFDAPDTLPLPTREGHQFDGWFMFDLPVTSLQDVSSDVVLRATWSVISYELSVLSEGVLLYTLSIPYNQHLDDIKTPLREGYVFDGFTVPLPDRMPAQPLEREVRWVAQPTEAPSTVTFVTSDVRNALAGSIDLEDTDEVVLRVTVIEPEETPLQDITLITSNQRSDQAVLFFDVRLIVRSQFEEFSVRVLQEHLTITMVIPEADRGFTDYQVVRVHEGVFERLETVYDTENQTLTFQTDRFSTYALFYEVPQSSNMVWIPAVIGVLALTGVVIWLVKHPSLFVIFGKKDDDSEEPNDTTGSLED